MAEEEKERMSTTTGVASQMSCSNYGDGPSACPSRYSHNSPLETFITSVNSTSVSSTSFLDGSNITLKQAKMLFGEMWGQSLPTPVNMDNFRKDGLLYEETKDLLQKGYLRCGENGLEIPESVDVKAIAARCMKSGNDEIIDGLMEQFAQQSKNEAETERNRIRRQK